ncbi:MAG: glycosyltransferase family 2 protein [Theionarchaea archaeon]|nr:glycosyltransferase family 2 protein [Theionarchaea archaeon]
MVAVPQASLIVPTLNEVENIGFLITEVFRVVDESGISLEMIVVDDGSVDGTREAVIEMARGYQVKLIERPCKMGITSAVLEGFEKSSAPVIGVMDSDLSHPPEKIPDLIQPIMDGTYDMTIGSRYIEGGNTKNWPLKRRLISKTAGLLSRPLTGIRDPMSGYFFLKSDLVESLVFNTEGWKICLEILVRAKPDRVKEVPIVFSERAAGSSKLGWDTVIGFVHDLLDLYAYRFFKSSFKTLVKFCIVGGIGVLLNLAILSLLVDYVGLWYMLAAVITFFIVAVNNFVWNKIWSFRDLRGGIRIITSQITKFVGSSLVALGINLSVLYTMVEFLGVWYILGQIVAICFAVVANFALNSLWVFRDREREI